METGVLIRTTHGSHGANGSFMVNPSHASWDSRGLLAGKDLDPMETVIEEVITELCYGGVPYSKEVGLRLALPGLDRNGFRAQEQR